MTPDNADGTAEQPEPEIDQPESERSDAPLSGAARWPDSDGALPADRVPPDSSAVDAAGPDSDSGAPDARPAHPGAQDATASEAGNPALAAEPGAAAGADPGAPSRRRPSWWPRRRKRQKAPWWELPVLIVIAIGVAVLIKTFVVQPFYI